MTEGQEGWGKGQGGVDGWVVAEPGRTRPVESYEDLRVWQASIDLVEGVYNLTRAFPDDERFGLVSQLRRAVVSIPSNIAEGWGRGSKQDYIRFLRIARGSLYEVRTQLVLVQRLEFGSASEAAALLEASEPLRRQLQGLITAVERSGN